MSCLSGIQSSLILDLSLHPSKIQEEVSVTVSLVNLGHYCPNGALSCIVQFGLTFGLMSQCVCHCGVCCSTSADKWCVCVFPWTRHQMLMLLSVAFRPLMVERDGGSIGSHGYWPK